MPYPGASDCLVRHAPTPGSGPDATSPGHRALYRHGDYRREVQPGCSRTYRGHITDAAGVDELECGHRHSMHVQAGRRIERRFCIDAGYRCRERLGEESSVMQLHVELSVAALDTPCYPPVPSPYVPIRSSISISCDPRPRPACPSWRACDAGWPAARQSEPEEACPVESSMLVCQY